ncbi:uncharacterized protein B0I36DRAFT_300220 [Microdochium trichocladiopsis]|uniref:Zn(2)-C6 fungal-type domain-containing protein n=1 Tax=Microdochium trichocladiopsis TaxID=1682393 RepID=A0A9P9BHI4_9PEZI|nr:uncharacterized protein B0I36DRAFT_300220 [Microdochium trichocladiopsis]KAH7010865.1 hypothetical protein B0I36DRAFT_300220 [Microdochium trichocladiopsis]
MPCTRCFRAGSGMSCRMAADSNRCERCIRDKKQCDGVAVASSLSRVLQTQRELEKDEDAAEEEIFALQEEMNRLQQNLGLSLARLRRIRTLKRNAESRGKELFQRGMIELDREDGILPALDAHELELTSELVSMEVPPDLD